MTPADMTEVLGACSAYDGRTIGITDVAAWHKAIGNLDKSDAVEAVAKHYGQSRERIMPADIANGCKAIRNDRAARVKSEVLALPSRFESDEIRDARLRAGLELCLRALRMPEDDDETDPQAIAVNRSRRERTTPLPMHVKRKGEGKPIDLDKIPGPEWSKTEVRERESVAHLHSIDRPCGRPACTKPACRRTPKES